jgi:hypothetical protein
MKYNITIEEDPLGWRLTTSLMFGRTIIDKGIEKTGIGMEHIVKEWDNVFSIIQEDVEQLSKWKNR